MANLDDTQWWRQAVIYQIYPRSFYDASGDGLGDLKGITAKADYLAKLGIDAVWLSPFYPSELADGGYDVADYRNVDPRLGTLGDFDEMTTVLHALGIKVIVDIVPNHTSDQHEWFKEALVAGPGSPARDRYIFRNGQGDHGELPPTDWESIFGGPAWHQVTDGQWYLHLFAREQPDLNWKNLEVQTDFLKTIKFWSDRGVDGFRVDVAHGLAKDLSTPLPSKAELEQMPIDGHHPIWDRDEVQDIYAQWREVFNQYDPPRCAVAEAWVAADRVPRYANPNSLGQSFNFDLLRSNFAAESFRTIVSRNLELSQLGGSSSTWVLSNHDVVRHPTRYGLPNSTVDERGEYLINPGRDWIKTGGTQPELDRVKGQERALAATLFILALPGCIYLYQGEELGLHEVAEIPAKDRQDPTFFRSAGFDYGRDGCRVPLPWDCSVPSYGFSPVPAHLPQPEWFGPMSVQAQEDQVASVLKTYRQALAARKAWQSQETLTWLETRNPQVLAYQRPNGWTCVTNFSDIDYPLENLTALSDLLEAVKSRKRVVISSQKTFVAHEQEGISSAAKESIKLLPARCTWWFGPISTED